jgi:ATP-dependent DNA helicase RecG
VVGARIRRVFVGMTDPNPDIRGRGVQYLMNHRVEVDFFDLDLVHQIMETNREFIDYWEAAERTTSTFAEPFEGPSGKELEVVERASLDDLSRDALSRYVSGGKKKIRAPSNELWKLMERAGFVARTKKGKAVPTMAGIILFATEPAEILPQCRVSIEAKKGGRTVSGDFEGPLLSFRDHLERFFKEQMRQFTEIRELDRIQVAEYPMEAIREAAFNAVIHRDYEAGARAHITLKETEVEVRSPGGLLKPLSLSRVRTFNAPPYSRNPHIALAAQRMGWIEEKGSGLARMRDAMITHGLRPPLFDFADGYFVVTLPGHEQAWSTVRLAPGLLAKLGRQQQKIVDLVMTRGHLAAGESAKELNIDVATARRHLRKLVDSGLLESRGSGPRLAYYLAGSA